MLSFVHRFDDRLFPATTSHEISPRFTLHPSNISLSCISFILGTAALLPDLSGCAFFVATVSQCAYHRALPRTTDCLTALRDRYMSEFYVATIHTSLADVYA